MIIEWVAAGITAVGIIALAKAIMTGLAISRRPSHHLAEQTGTKPVPPAAQVGDAANTSLWGDASHRRR
jgi:hypothetical protein